MKSHFSLQSIFVATLTFHFHVQHLLNQKQLSVHESPLSSVNPTLFASRALCLSSAANDHIA